MASSDLIQSITRAMQILEYLGQAPDAQSLDQISRHMSLKTTTVHNILRTLAARDFVEKQDKPPRYKLGSAAGKLADQQRDRSLMKQISDQMLLLHQQFASARLSFAERVGGQVTATLRIGPEMPNQLQRGAGQPMSPYASASALLHQALWPAAMLQTYRQSHPFIEYGAHLWPSIEHLDIYLETVRDQQIARPHFEHDADCRMAVPIFDEGGKLAGAMGVFLPDAQAMSKEIPVIQKAIIAAARSAGGAQNKMQPRKASRKVSG